MRSRAMAAALTVMLLLPPAASGHPTVVLAPSEVRGVVNPEDLVALPGTPWLVSGGVAGAGATSGALFLVDVATRSATRLFPAAGAAFRHDRALYGDCPGPPAKGRFEAHGINVRPAAPQRYRLYSVNHQGREAVEVFDLDARAARPRITWIGCVLTPAISRAGKPWAANAVAPLGGNDLAVTINPPVDWSDPATQRRLKSGELRGRVLIWRARQGWRTLPRSDLLFNNGLEASRDGRWLYVAASYEPAVYRLPLAPAGSGRARVRLPFYPDNLRWGDDGRLHVVGPVAGLEEELACVATRRSCPPFKVASIDPATLRLRVLLTAASPGGDRFTLATGVARRRDMLWVSSAWGTRILAFPAGPAGARQP